MKDPLKDINMSKSAFLTSSNTQSCIGDKTYTDSCNTEKNSIKGVRREGSRGLWVFQGEQITFSSVTKDSCHKEFCELVFKKNTRFSTSGYDSMEGRLFRENNGRLFTAFCRT